MMSFMVIGSDEKWLGHGPHFKLFYIIFDKISDFSIPRNAGDFSLIDRKVYKRIVECEERDLFLRGIRAYVGYNQIGVPYKRPERMFGLSTNSLIKNINWAKKAIFAYSSQPLHFDAFFIFLCFASFVLITMQELCASEPDIFTEY